MCDVGDIFCPANITKAHDQITKGVAHILSQGTLPMIMGGDHSIGYPCVRGVAQCVEGKVGIIHLDRHVDTQERDMDEIMHTCPWFHATNIANVPPSNLVQLGIGGWQVPRAGVRAGRERGTTVLTVSDIERIGIDKTIEIALEVAWKGASAVYLSFDIDAVDAGFVPGTGWPEPGGFLPREALKIIEGVAKEGIAAMESSRSPPIPTLLRRWPSGHSRHARHHGEARAHGGRSWVGDCRLHIPPISSGRQSLTRVQREFEFGVTFAFCGSERVPRTPPASRLEDLLADADREPRMPPEITPRQQSATLCERHERRHGLIAELTPKILSPLDMIRR